MVADAWGDLFAGIGRKHGLVLAAADEVVGEVVGRAHHHRQKVDGEDGDLGPAQAAVDAAPGGEADVDVAENGESNGQPDGYRVTHNAEAGVEHQEEDPAQTARGEGPQAGLPHEVEVDGEGQVRHHGQKIGHGQPHEDGVRGRDHVLASQHDDVGRVGHEAEEAHRRADIAVKV